MSCLRTIVMKCAVLAALGSASASGIEERMEELHETPITAADREHWSFRELRRPAVPKVADTSWARTPIDCFILTKLTARQLTPQPPAGRVTLIRRLYFDLLGLPPGPHEVDAFVADRSENAYERLVESLLASPSYGERWAQHWLDVARFAETDGFEFDAVRPEAWRYRDWVIDALNRDLPYSEFVQLQLAGDELDPGNPAAQTATTFCLSGPDMPDVNSQEERRHQLLNEMTSTVGSVLLGLQLGCAQCHDHKYDPLSLLDFYRMRAVFEPALQLRKKESVSTLREEPGANGLSFVMLRGDWQRRGPAIEPGFPRIANLAEMPFPKRDPQRPTSGRRSAFAKWLTSPGHPLTARVMANRIWQHHFGEGLSRTSGDFGTVGDSPTHPELLDWLSVELNESGWSLKHLHRAIVLSAVYRQSSRHHDSEWPGEWSAPAVENWNRSVAKDPANLFLARFPRQRLSGEAIRDAMLSAADALNMTPGGPSVRPPLPAGILGTLLKNQWIVSPRPADHLRRSIYVFARRNLRYPIFEAFDRPDAIASCPRRSKSTTAPQSLLLLNSELSLDLSRRLADRVSAAEPACLANQIRLAVRCAFGRLPTDQELETFQKFCQDQSTLLREEAGPGISLAGPMPASANIHSYDAAALSDLCLALWNASEFLYVD